MRSRKGARKKRRKRATPFKRNGHNLLPAQKKQCYEEANIDSTPSYVELLTCLEMERDVKTERGGKMSK